MDFISSENLCGQNLLRIASRGSAIIAELLRLSCNIPEVFLGPDNIKDPDQKKYLAILFDFQYLRQPEEYEKRINENSDLMDLDIEFQDNHKDILKRFYLLFLSIWRFQADFMKTVDDIVNGFYIQYSLTSILNDTVGRQLLCELLYLYGVMLIFLEEKIPGIAREKILIATYRLNGEIGLENVDEVCKLCRNTGFLPGIDGKRPKNHPETVFARYPPHKELLRLLIGKLQTDDIYNMSDVFPSPDHRSTRLANQAAMLYVILYFEPDILYKQKATMREIVDRYFNDNWVITLYMGEVVDLAIEWAPYPAAKAALDNVFQNTTVKALNESNSKLFNQCIEELKIYLKEGILLQDYLLSNTEVLLNCIRRCNIALRWRLLHRKTRVDSFRKIIDGTIIAPIIVTLLLNASHLEYIVKGLFQQLLDEKDEAWTTGKSAAADRMDELSEYFTGEKALTRVKKDDNLMRWFATLASEVRALNLSEGHATATGRKIQGIIAALEDVEQFEAVDTNVQIKTFLIEVRDIFRAMIKTVNIKEDILSILESISDLSYAWKTLGDYYKFFHDRISKDPNSVVLLRATFLKAASILDVPLIRITAIDSPDAVSVAAYYSGELVEFVRIVLEVVPVSVFNILGQIVSIQNGRMSVIPIRLEGKDLKDYAQLDSRCELAKLTHQLSIFTEGILVMEKTLLGVIQVDPRQILEEGLRRELVRLISFALNKYLTFKDMTRLTINENMNKVARTLDGLKKSIEYLQDFISIAGLKIYQQEFSRVVNYYTEQEANRFIKKKTYDATSRYQSKAIPIPRLVDSSPLQDDEDSIPLTFMGRVMSSLLHLTDPSRTMYSLECSAWFETHTDQKNISTSEMCGVRHFALLERSIGTIGLRGLDRLLAFRNVYIFNQFIKYYNRDVYPFRTLLDQVRGSLFPEYKIPNTASKFYANVLKKVEVLMLPLLKIVRKVGQGQLLRRQIANLVQFGCQLDAHLLYQAVDTYNRALLGEMHKSYTDSSDLFQSEKTSALCEMIGLVESCGLDNPIHKIYLTSQPLEGLPVLLFMFLLTYLPKLEYDANFGSLVRRKLSYPLDGMPLVTGISCLLRQFHPSYTNKLLSYLGQFVRSNLQEAFSEIDTKQPEVSKEALNVLVFMDQLCSVSSIPRAFVHEYVPPYVFDALVFNKSTGSKK